MFLFLGTQCQSSLGEKSPFAGLAGHAVCVQRLCLKTLKCFPDLFNVLYLDEIENCAVNSASRELFLRVIWKVSFLALVLSLTQTCFYSPPHPDFINFYWNKHRKKQPPFFRSIFYVFAEAKSSTRKRGCG